MPDIINDIKWKYLIILDACRYDYFAKLYKNYFSEDKVVSFVKLKTYARDTREWLHKNFDGKKYDDIIYISANPLINSKGILPKKRAFDARKHFYKVIDVWDYGWKNGVVPPDEVNKAVIVAKGIYKNKRFIIHYVQPHEPYVNYDCNYSPQQMFGFYSDFKTKINNILLKFISHETLWKLLKKYPIVKTTWGMRKIWETGGRQAIQKAYENNLRYVLSHVSNLVNHLNGIKVITADHGELLGEDGYYGHHPKYPSKLQEIVYQVPLLIIK